MNGNGAGPGTRETRPRAARQPRVARLQSKFAGFRERIRWNPVLDTAWRTGIFVVGWLIVLAGVVMLVFPGPGWGAIFLGFALLATEFAWARRALSKVNSAAREATHRALEPEVRPRNLVIAGAVLAVAAAGVALYVWAYGVPSFVPFVGGVEVGGVR